MYVMATDPQKPSAAQTPGPDILNHGRLAPRTPGDNLSFILKLGADTHVRTFDVIIKCPSQVSGPGNVSGQLQGLYHIES
jgi:hypothetical protein